jgi:hypothetical protein
VRLQRVHEEALQNRAYGSTVSPEVQAMSNSELVQLRALAEAGRRARVVPSLLSTDLRRTAAFYEKLGFRVEAVDNGDDPSGRLGLERDGIYLFFYSEPLPNTPAAPALSGTIYVFPESVDALAQEWRHKVAFRWGPELMPYGLYEFGTADPDGYHLSFAERRR